jgi:hypothetical protein
MAERTKRYKEALSKLDNWSLGEDLATNEEIQLLIKQPELRAIKGKTTVNPAAVAFKPEVFTGRKPELAENWWKKLTEYLRLAEVGSTLFCSLTRLLLGEEAGK